MDPSGKMLRLRQGKATLVQIGDKEFPVSESQRQ
jgi:hypothetical protein